MRILIAEPLDAAAVKLLQQQPGWEVVVSNPKEYAPASGGGRRADCPQLGDGRRRDTLAAAPKLRVIGRAGVGVDNIDLQRPPLPAFW